MQIFFVDAIKIHRDSAGDLRELAARFHRNVKRLVVVSQNRRIAFWVAPTVHDAGMILDTLGFPSIDGVTIGNVRRAHRFNFSALMIKGHVAHRRRKRVHGGKCAAQIFPREKIIKPLIPVQV